MKYSIERIEWVEFIFAPMEDVNSVTIEIMCKAGSIYENSQNNGISHFLEHLFFKWWKKYPTPQSVAEAVDKFGWEFNAYTWEEYAGYYVKCAPNFINQAVDVLWDMMISPQFPKDELEREKWVVIQELKMYEDNPMALVMNKRQTYFYGDNSYGRPIIWTIDNINSFNQDMLKEHKTDLYTKDNLIIVIAGKIEDIKGLKVILADTFGYLPGGKRINKPLFKHILPPESKWFWDKKTEQNHLVISAVGLDWNDDRRYAAWVLATIMWWNMSSRLFQNIREKQGLCYYIRALHGISQDFWTFMIRAGIDKDRFDFGIDKIYEEIEKIAKREFSQEEFDNAIWYNVWQVQMWIESSNEMANFLWSQYLIYNKIETLDEILQKYKSLTINDVKDIAWMLSKENLYLYWIQ